MTRSLFVATACCGLLVASLWAAPGLAQDDRARMHFQAGASYYEAGDYADALREFQRSHALSQRSELFYNFSLCYQQLGDLEQAAQYLRRFLDEVPTVENRDQLERRHANLLERIAQQHADPEQPVDTTDPDPPDTDAPDTDTDATDAASTPAAPDASDEPPADTRAASSGVHPGAIAGYATAGVGVAMAVTFGAMALRERSDVEAGCGADRSCTRGQVQRMDRLALVADLGIAVAVAGATVGTIFLIRGRRDSSDATEARVAVSPYAGPTGAGALIQGQF
ncbi:MAG: tetratricopeptide repeat protein [Polyangiales bacterium]|nr:tetratricopeptide repeat protein [Myxococcales bacterium]MCB9656384.1 tetratricopeptide repeat protein [Sandaracinaceae bacterium]